MWRDSWLAIGLIGAALSCLACLTPLVVLTLAAVGRAWARHVDVVLLPVVLLFIALAVEAMVDAVNRLGFRTSIKGTRPSAAPPSGR